MRMMLRFTLPVEKSNAAINDGSLGRTMESILSKLKPEAAYFAPLDGKRAGMIFFDMAEPSQIIEAVEPLFLSLNATTELLPVMNADDLRKGLAKVAENSWEWPQSRSSSFPVVGSKRKSTALLLAISQLCHVWTAPAVQGKRI